MHIALYQQERTMFHPASHTPEFWVEEFAAAVAALVVAAAIVLICVGLA